MPLDQNPHQTMTRFGCVGFQCMCAGFLCPKCDNFACLLTRHYQTKLHLKRWFFFAKIGIFCKSIASLLSQGLYAKLVSMMSLKCSTVEDDGELMLIGLHTHFLPQQQYSRIYTLFLTFHALVYRWGCQCFFHFFSQEQDTELTVLLFFQNPYAIFTLILQHYHWFSK